MGFTGIKIKDLVIDPPLLLAPMAGLTHSALRTVLLSFGGIGLLSTEMLSARRLPVERQELSPYLVTTAAERPLSYQLLLTAEREVKPAVAVLERLGADAIDLNLGCPAPTIRQAGGGSSLMAAPDLVRSLVAAVRRETALPLTAKIRLGEELDAAKLRDFCTMLEGEGIDMLTVHARLRHERFCRKPRWEWVGRVKEWLTIPVIANGSVGSVADAQNCLRESGADGLMIGRAAASTPWVFAEIASALAGGGPAPLKVILPRIYLDFYQNLVERFQSERRLGRLKEFTHYFAKNYFFGHRLASAVQASPTMEEARERACTFFARNDPAWPTMVAASSLPDVTPTQFGEVL